MLNSPKLCKTALCTQHRCHAQRLTPDSGSSPQNNSFDARPMSAMMRGMFLCSQQIMTVLPM